MKKFTIGHEVINGDETHIEYNVYEAETDEQARLMCNLAHPDNKIAKCDQLLDTVNGLTKDEWIAKYSVPRNLYLWSSKPEVKDFVPEIYQSESGDNMQLVEIGSMGQRPWYWLVWIDSHIDDRNELSDEVLENVINTVEENTTRFDSDIASEEEFLKLKVEDSESYNYCDGSYRIGDFEDWADYKSHTVYPAFSWDGGYMSPIVNFLTGEYDKSTN